MGSATWLSQAFGGLHTWAFSTTWALPLPEAAETARSWVGYSDNGLSRALQRCAWRNQEIWELASS